MDVDFTVSTSLSRGSIEHDANELLLQLLSVFLFMAPRGVGEGPKCFVLTFL